MSAYVTYDLSIELVVYTVWKWFSLILYAEGETRQKSISISPCYSPNVPVLR